MNVLEVIASRCSVRDYDGREISEQNLEKILEAARLAQSANNRQPWRFIIVRNPSLKKDLANAADHQSFVSEAAVVIVCLGDPSKSSRVGPFDSFIIDCAIAIENMVLTAWDLGIGSCWIGAFDEEEVKRLLDVPSNLRVVSLLTLGYPAPPARYKLRKRLEEIVYFESYGRTKRE